jgi:hypothetical protein
VQYCFARGFELLDRGSFRIEVIPDTVAEDIKGAIALQRM